MRIFSHFPWVAIILPIAACAPKVYKNGVVSVYDYDLRSGNNKEAFAYALENNPSPIDITLLSKKDDRLLSLVRTGSFGTGSYKLMEIGEQGDVKPLLPRLNGEICCPIAVGEKLFLRRMSPQGIELLKYEGRDVTPIAVLPSFNVLSVAAPSQEELLFLGMQGEKQTLVTTVGLVRANRVEVIRQHKGAAYFISSGNGSALYGSKWCKKFPFQDCEDRIYEYSMQTTQPRLVTTIPYSEESRDYFFLVTEFEGKFIYAGQKDHLVQFIAYDSNREVWIDLFTHEDPSMTVRAKKFPGVTWPFAVLLKTSDNVSQQSSVEGFRNESILYLLRLDRGQMEQVLKFRGALLYANVNKKGGVLRYAVYQ